MGTAVNVHLSWLVVWPCPLWLFLYKCIGHPAVHRHWPIMLPIGVCCSAHEIHLKCSRLCSQFVSVNDRALTTIIVALFIALPHNHFIMIVLLEYINFFTHAIKQVRILSILKSYYASIMLDAFVLKIILA